MIAAVCAAATALVLAAALRPSPPRRTTSTDPPGGRHRRDAAPRWDRFLDGVAADVRGGASLRHAVVATATRLCPDHPIADPTGDPTGDAGWAIGDPDLAVVRQTLAAAATFGGATAATVQSGANLLRERAAVRAEAAAHSAQARLSARVLTLVPVGFAAWSAAVSAGFRAALATPAGVTAAAVGALLNVTGWVWMRRIVRSAAT